MGPTDWSATRCISHTCLQTSGTTYRSGIRSRSFWCWPGGRLWCTASKPRSEYSLNIQNGQPTSLWSATAFFPVFGESAAVYEKDLTAGRHIEGTQSMEPVEVATPLGFEPRITPPKGAVLPLHHGVCAFGILDRRFSIQVQCPKFKG